MTTRSGDSLQAGTQSFAMTPAPRWNSETLNSLGRSAAWTSPARVRLSSNCFLIGAPPQQQFGAAPFPRSARHGRLSGQKLGDTTDATAGVHYRHGAGEP